MGRYRLTALISVPILFLAALAPPTQEAFVRGDANGDRRVDVLDIQAVLDAVIADSEADPRTDVNGNGQTNILDFQLTQAQATATPERRPAPEQELPLKACHFSNPPAPWIRFEQTVTVVALAQPSPRPFLRSPDAGIDGIDSKTERYLYGLTPNAPPAYA
jgi:hypothetical protein